MNTHIDRIFAKVNLDGPVSCLGTKCWIWTGATSRASKGKTFYGYFRSGEKIVKAHRHMYELIINKIPEGLVIDHLCRNPLCVNPTHMEPVTSGENTRRGHSYRKSLKAAHV